MRGPRKTETRERETEEGDGDREGDSETEGLRETQRETEIGARQKQRRGTTFEKLRFMENEVRRMGQKQKRIRHKEQED